MKAAVIIFCAMAAGCSYTPVADLRASGDKAQVYQRDLSECRELVKEAFPWAFANTGPALSRCLQGRGHSILNVQ